MSQETGKGGSPETSENKNKVHCWMPPSNPPGNFHSRTGEPVHSLNEILNVLEF